MADRVQVPDVMDDRQRANVVIGRLRALQQERFSLNVERIAQGRSPDDEWQAAIDDDRPAVTYKQRDEQLASAEQELMSEHSSLRSQIDRVLAEEQKAIAAQQAAAEAAASDSADESG